MDHLIAEAHKRVTAEGLTLDTLFAASDEVVIFGSRAAGCAASDSDIDILVFGEGLRLKSERLDLVCIPARLAGSPEWLDSELAGHVAAHGVWIHGQRRWTPRLGSASSVARKRSLIAAEYGATMRRWQALAPWARAKHLTSVLRNLQRLAILDRGGAVPPTPVLEAAVEASPDYNILLLSVAARMNAAGFCGAPIIATDDRSAAHA